MAHIKSIGKVEKYLSENSPVTISNIIMGAKLPAASVKDVLMFLDDYGRVNLISNGKVTMVQYLGESHG